MNRASVAYDYKRLAQKEAEKRPQIREVKTRASVKSAESFSIRKAVVMMVAVVSMLSILLYSQVKQTELLNEYNQVLTELSAVKGEVSSLTKTLEDTLSVANVEQAAVDELGMQKVESYQMRYITFETEDASNVVQEPGVWEKICGFFSGLFS